MAQRVGYAGHHHLALRQPGANSEDNGPQLSEPKEGKGDIGGRGEDDDEPYNAQ